MTVRTAVTGSLTALALAAGALLGAPASAALADPGPEPVAPGPVVMGGFPLEAYGAEAAGTPPELAAALERDLGITPEQFYAQADAAATASEVVDALQATGTVVLGSRLEGTELVVTVPTESDAAAARQAGALAEVGGSTETTPSRQSADLPDAEFLRDLVGGQGYYNHKGLYDYFCSVGFNGIDGSTGAAQFLTAGHCVTPGAEYSGRVFSLEQPRPGQDPTVAGTTLGSPLPASLKFGSWYDTALYATAPAWTPQPAVGSWGGNQGSAESGERATVRDYTRAVVGQSICKSGRKTGWTCGTVKSVDIASKIGSTDVNAFLSNICALGGDSGGAVIAGSYAVGVISFGDYKTGCGESGRTTGSFPIDSPFFEDALEVQTSWEPLVDVAAPVSEALLGGVPLYRGEAAAGTVPGGGLRHTVHLSVDGGPETLVPVGADGRWSIPDAAGIGAGSHSVSLFASYGEGIQRSKTVTGTVLVADRPAVSRLDGATRFDVAVAVADEAFPGTAPVVYVATGTNYPDALSAGPAAVAQGGPLLPVLPDAVPDVVAAKIAALKPARIVVVGGTDSVRDSVRSTLAQLVPDARIDRLAGADRYEASRAVVADAFTTEPHAYVATGGGFADALSAGGAAGSKGEPVVLVNGPAATADAPTLDLFRGLKSGSLTVAGGPFSVSQGVADSLGTGVPAAVSRVSGDDRYATSIALNADAFDSADTVYLATGLNFPDALAGGVLAGLRDAPLYVVPGDCVPRGVLEGIADLGATDVVLLGGTTALKPAVQELAACGF
ncbi:cell wall-binding repeat-containing protein [Herbiconiux sp. CPCC 205716]|uniref:Cell wall-binding repeat-containing protein n=1 Tax=Herbiconiux gentiana TaxID=2970912 RepID=A0ABT2GCS6_9MICO|nr:cell wall-binding repeat-containing protein [Herbiconiux gentiana]MCS5713990.1 cell wall-binding repeat-containing protein [Herbiconiux gentiana]